MSRLLATLYPHKFIPPKGKPVPRARVMVSEQEADRTARKQSLLDNKEKVLDLIKRGVNTAADVSDHLGFTKATISGYFRQLEADGVCYRIEGRSNEPVRMFVY
jgi:uncharacterized membrane protein